MLGWAEFCGAGQFGESRTEFSKSGGHGGTVPTLHFPGKPDSSDKILEENEITVAE
jgi:hypothetical protein